MWWQPLAGEALDDPLMLAATGGSAAAAAGGELEAAAGADAGGAPGGNTAKLLQLAAAQRMNTDARRAVFIAIMGSEVRGYRYAWYGRMELR